MLEDIQVIRIKAELTFILCCVFGTAVNARDAREIQIFL